MIYFELIIFVVDLIVFPKNHFFVSLLIILLLIFSVNFVSKFFFYLF